MTIQDAANALWIVDQVNILHERINKLEARIAEVSDPALTKQIKNELLNKILEATQYCDTVEGYDAVIRSMKEAK